MNEDEDCEVGIVLRRRCLYHQPLSAPVNPRQPAPICCSMTLNGDATINSLLLALALNEALLTFHISLRLIAFLGNVKNSGPSEYSFERRRKNEFAK